jgi:hypothetical protein
MGLGHDRAVFPETLVVGLDLVPGKPGPPPRYEQVSANLLQGLSLVDGAFHFVHQQLLFLAIPSVPGRGSSRTWSGSPARCASPSAKGHEAEASRVA